MQGGNQKNVRAIGGSIETRDVLWLLGSLCNLHRVPFDARLVSQEFPPPHDLGTLIDVTRRLGFRAALSPQGRLDWPAVPLPAIGFLREESTPQVTSAALQPVLIVKVSGNDIYCFRPGGQEPEVIRTANADARLNEQVLLIASPSSAGTTGDDGVFAFTGPEGLARSGSGAVGVQPYGAATRSAQRLAFN